MKSPTPVCEMREAMEDKERVEMGKARVLSVRNLTVDYPTPERTVHAVKDISFDVCQGEMLGLIGESGSGKTTAANGILRLLEKPGRVTAGEALFRDQFDLFTLSEKEYRRLRWRELALISQGAMNSLNPTMRIKDQIADGIKTHEGRQDGTTLRKRILHLFKTVGLPDRIYNQYPHELSGGMKQRVGIAMAVALNPSFVVADEPTSALDVITQRVVAQTLLDIKDEMGISVLLIGHDIALMAQLADRMAVMYDGHIVESGSARDILLDPAHPYTQMLIDSTPSITEHKPLKVVSEATKQEFSRHLITPVEFEEIAPGHRVAKFV